MKRNNENPPLSQSSLFNPQQPFRQNAAKNVSDNHPLMQQPVAVRDETWEEFLKEMEEPTLRFR